MGNSEIGDDRKDGRARGLRIYNGGPCKKHGSTLKYTATSTCVECQAEYNQTWYEKNYTTEKARLAGQVYRDKHREEYREYQREYHREYMRKKRLAKKNERQINSGIQKGCSE